MAAAIRSLVQTEVLPTPMDTIAAFGAGRAFVRRVPRENLWIWFQVADRHLELLAVKDEPPVPLDE